MMNILLPKPKRYFPVSKNPFAFTTGLRSLTKSQNVIEVDADYPVYLQNKFQNRHESFTQYVQDFKLREKIKKATIQYLIKQISQEWPSYFSLEKSLNKLTLINKITSEIIIFDSEDLSLIKSHKNNYEDALDALMSQIQEDISVIETTPELDHIVYLHLCSPNFWSAEEKIGKSFIKAHESVPDMEKMKQNYVSINHMLTHSGPFERFTWGLTTNKNLNQHPLKQNGESRRFHQAANLVLRIERQVTVPMAVENSYLFFIRTYFEDIKQLNEFQKRRLKLSLETMSDAVLQYKGLSQYQEWLSNALSDNK